MINRDIIIDLRVVTSSSGPHQIPTLSAENLVFGTKKETSAEEKSRANLAGEVNITRVDINEENYNGETVVFLPEDIKQKQIYKTVAVRNKIYLYISDAKTEKT